MAGVTIDDLPEQVRDALTRGEEVLLFTTGAVSSLEGNPDTDGINTETDAGWPEEPTPAALTLAQALHAAVKDPVGHYLRRQPAARIAQTHRRHADPRMPIFTIKITGKLNADGTLAARADLTVHEAVYGIGAARVAADRALLRCRNVLAREGMAWS